VGGPGPLADTVDDDMMRVWCVVQKRQELLQFWIDKHESDVEQKQRELDLLKSAKAKDLERLQELTRLVNINAPLPEKRKHVKLNRLLVN